MNVCIAGVGWVTPLGSTIEEVWNQLLAGNIPPIAEVSDPLGNKSYPAYQVPPSALRNLPPHPRLRRASAISRFAAAAGLAALTDANLTNEHLQSKQLALVFAVANGGVIYTKRFYRDIVDSGAGSASPLLFPETVFNAAASHVAAIIGLNGTCYTVVGDGSVGLTGIQMAEDVMSDPSVDYCLVIAAEEADWLLCDAYQKWRLLRRQPPIEVFASPAGGTILSEGAGAVLLARTGPVQVAATSAGAYFARREKAGTVLARVLEKVGTSENAMVIGSANGTFVDAAESSAMDKVAPSGVLYAIKGSLGEGVAAGALWQVIAGVRALTTAQMPQPQYPKRAAADRSLAKKLTDRGELTVLSCGLNQHAGAVRLRRA
ncbi:MAG TPA: beta-ketoacyl synthase N-terminal-like domain-containing protein [Chthoniobacterales bacterium]|nr:beta-ketoacyl synthase N-terminal-like domain-containing protein [Chthoniobacterales bacterium]